MSVLHVMADGFPASNLTLEYHVRLTPVLIKPVTMGPPVSPRVAIRDQQGEAQLRRAVKEIFAALQASPAGEQVIFFAQDRQFLRAVKDVLLHPDRLDDANDNSAPSEIARMVLDDADIGLLDSGVPEWARRRLIEPRERDSKRVFLMTSSGSRGVSFPLATVIIALVPRFAVESGFMEIVQLVYRGRGFSEPCQVDGDALDRRIVLSCRTSWWQTSRLTTAPGCDGRSDLGARTAARHPSDQNHRRRRHPPPAGRACTRGPHRHG